MLFLIRELENVGADLEKSSLKFNEILLDNSAWEEETKLRLKDGKNAVKLTAQKYEKSLKSTTEMIEKIAGTSELLANKNSNNRKEVADVLKAVSAKLEIADRSGKSAEKLLKQAKAQGDKESAKYLKFLPAAVPAVASTPVLAKAP